MEVNWNVIAGEIMTQALRVLVPLFVILAIKWVTEIYRLIRKQQPEWIPVLDYAAQLAVLAAEQIFGDGQGAEKKQYAIKTIQRILAENGIHLDLNVIEDAIEAEVWNWLNHSAEKQDLAQLAEFHEPAESPESAE